MITIKGNYADNKLTTIRASHGADSTHSHTRSVKGSGERTRHCNICRQAFTPEFRFQLFCGKCRKQDDSFMFSEWLPHIPERYALQVGR